MTKQSMKRARTDVAKMNKTDQARPPVDTDWTRRSENEQPNHALCNALQLNALETANAMVDKNITYLIPKI